MNQVGAVTVEKYFSVVAELSGGRKKLLPLSGESSSHVFQQARQMPDVRRVGKVTEITRASFEAVQQGREPDPAVSQPEQSAPPQRSDKWIRHVISGPRIIMHDRPTGGEQPFKQLQPPPERPKPKKPDPEAPPKHPHPRSETAIKTAARDSVNQGANQSGANQSPVGAAKPVGAEYRILKSRRQEGLPYLLQRGAWQEQKGKRAFRVDSEKGFATREEAERRSNGVVE